jgi:hypothetical protein
MLAIALVAFYLMKGRIRSRAVLSGGRILRFNLLRARDPLDGRRAASSCWRCRASTSPSARHLLLPLLGPRPSPTCSQCGAKYAHNYLAWPFMLGHRPDVPDLDEGQHPRNASTCAGLRRAAGIVGKEASAGGASMAARRWCSGITVLRRRGAGGLGHLPADLPLRRHRRRACNSGTSSTASSAVLMIALILATSISARSAWRAPSTR